MHFLCLHGMGTNNQIFEMQTAALRYELGDHHTYEFVEGTVPCPIAPEIQSLFSPNDEFFGYFDPSRPSTCQTALAQLERYVAHSGPFDGVLAFSQGAALASTLIVHLSHLDPAGQTLAPVFKVAVFIAGGVPVDPDLLVHRGELRQLSRSVDGCVISVPTANIYGRNDTLWPGSSEQLCGLCEEKAREVLVHDGGHEVPGSGTSKDALIGAVKVIRRAVDKAMHAQ